MTTVMIRVGQSFLCVTEIWNTGSVSPPLKSVKEELVDIIATVVKCSPFQIYEASYEISLLFAGLS